MGLILIKHLRVLDETVLDVLGQEGKLSTVTHVLFLLPVLPERM